MKNNVSVIMQTQDIMKKLTLILAFIIGGILTVQGQARITADSLVANSGDSVTFTLRAANIANAGSLTLFIQYNSSRLTFGRALNWNSQLTTEPALAGASGGVVAIAWASLTPATFGAAPGDVLVQLKFKYWGNYSYFDFRNDCEVTDALGNIIAVSYDDGAIVQPLRANAYASPEVICLGNSSTLHASGFGGFPSYSYSWSSNPAGFTSLAQNPTVTPTVTTTYTVEVSDGVTTDDSSIVVTIFTDPAPGLVSGMLPTDGVVNLSLPIDMSWAPVPGATKYDLYVWENGTAKPGTPMISNINSIFHFFNTAIPYGKTYNWQLHSKNLCHETPGPVQQFSLRDLPDLIVTEITNGDTAYSQQTATVQWKIKNIGLGSTLSLRWNDGVYLCPDSVFNPVSATLVSNPRNLAWLQPGHSYTTDATFTISTNLVGKYYVFIKVNSTNQLLEQVTSNNMLRSAQTLTIIVPETPDMELRDFGAPTIATAADTITINFSVINEGGVHIRGNWSDRVWISPDSTINISQNTGSGMLGPNARAGAQYYHYQDTLLSDSSYFGALDLIIPHTFYGKYYLRAVADDQNQIFETASTNNLNDDPADTIEVILRPPADLVVTSITPPASALAGTPMMVGWTVQNQGLNPPYFPLETYWYDNIWISMLDTFNASQAIYLGNAYRYNGHLLNFGDSYPVNQSFNIPNGITGNYYIYVKTDAGDRVWEYNMEGNNMRRSDNPIFIGLVYADLLPTYLGAPDTIEAWVNFPLFWTVNNQGVGSANGTWYDHFYISVDTILSYGDCNLGSVIRGGPMVAGGTYSDNVTLSLPMPSSWAPGNYYILVKTDNNNNVYEYNFDNNNVTWDPVYFKYWDDLEVTALSSTNPGLSGQDITVNWSARSNEVYKLKTNGWFDKIWLSSDTLWGDDYYLGATYRSGYMVQNQTYSASLTGTLPHGCNGDFYILITSGVHPGCGYYDPCHACVGTFYDINMDNNKRWIPIHINLTTPCDLTIDTLIFPDTVYAGQNLGVPYEVDNIGPGVTLETSWYDCIYLNTVPQLNTNAVRIGTYHRNSALPGGSSYAPTMSTSIPSYLGGYYYVILVTDNHCSWPHSYPYRTLYCGHQQSGTVYEHYAEHNNIVIGLTLVIPPAPSDLIVTQVSMPDTAALGEQVSIPYNVKNVGPNTAVGFLRDGFYFSTDYELQGDLDQLFGLNERNLILHPGDSISGVIVNKIKDIDPGWYKGIASTDILNQVFENNDNNNETLAPDSILLTIKELFLSVPDTFGLDEGDLVYYKVVPGANKDLIITLNSNQIFGRNEIYVAQGRVPTLYDYDFIYEDPVGVNQEVIIPSTLAGEYFILVRTTEEYLGAQECIIKVVALPFSIISINSDTVGQGRVTTRLKGAGFKRDITRVFLKQEPSGTIITEGSIVNFLSSMQMDVRWELASVPVDTYTVVAVNCDSICIYDPDDFQQLNCYKVWACDSAQLYLGLTVQPSTGLQPAFATLIPTVVRIGTWAYWTYFLKNNGNIDIPYWDFQYYIPDGVPNIITHSIDIRKSTDFHVSNSMSSENAMQNDSTMIIPFVAKDIKPDQVMQVNLKLMPLRLGGFPVSWKQFPMYEEWYNAQTLEFVEAYRQTLLTSPSDFDNDAVTLAADSADLVDSLIRFYHSFGLVDSSYITADPQSLYNSANDETFFLTPCGDYDLSECFIHWRPDPFKPSFPEALILCKDSVLLLNETWGTSCTQVVGSLDPNDITGPIGFDSLWINATDRMNYRIRFENDPDFATAPAQRVYVTQSLDPDVAPFSFRLGSFGFGSYLFTVPDNSVSYNRRIDLPDSLGYDLNVSAGLNLINKSIFWNFQTIDPRTGLAPSDPDKGFLLINDSTGSGEGFVNYSIIPASGLNTGDSITAKALIYFDVNPPIFTNEWLNLVDAVAPGSLVDTLAPTYDTTAILIGAFGTDDIGGTGISHFRLYYSKDGAPFEEYPVTFKPDSSIWFTGASGSSYGFFSRAVDNVGNVETLKTTADRTTTLEPSNDTIQGYITYHNASSTPINGAKVYLKYTAGALIDSTVTDANGYYILTSQPVGDLTLFVTTQKPWGGNSAADALLLSRSVIGLEILDPLQEEAADVNNSNTKTSADALLIKRRIIGLESSFAAGDWVFESAAINYTKVSQTVNLKGLAMGDVNKSYNPAAKQQPGASLIQSGTLQPQSDGSFLLPVYIDRQAYLGSMTLFLNFPEHELQVHSVQSPLQDLLVNVEDGMIKMAWSSVDGVQLKGGSELLTIRLIPSYTGIEARTYDILLGSTAEFTDLSAQIIDQVPLRTMRMVHNISDFSLGNNYPNPFNGESRFEYNVPEAAQISIELYNSLGALVAILVDAQLESGAYSFNFDGHKLPAGVYTYTMKANTGQRTWQETKFMAIYH
jgi:hypothetical protein